jgi:hypothetical protein
MAAEGLWTVQFSKSEENHGGLQVSEEINRGGILVFTGNRIFGGGISFYFVGTYEEIDAGISITLNATKYNDLVVGPFGAVDEVRIIFKGTVDGDAMKLHGHVEDEPGKTLVVEAERRTEI